MSGSRLRRDGTRLEARLATWRVFVQSFVKGSIKVSLRSLRVDERLGPELVNACLGKQLAVYHLQPLCSTCSINIMLMLADGNWKLH
jgi:hypothetical protein